VAAEAGLDFSAGITDRTPLDIAELMGGGCGFVHANEDAWPDIVLAGYRGCALYLNRGGQRFENATQGSGLDRLAGAWHGVAAGDYDGDGLSDLMLTGHGRLALLRGLGGGRFADRTAAAGLRQGRWTTSAAFADVNGDGWLDLYVACYVRFEPGMPEFYESEGALLTLGPDAYPAEKGVLYVNRGDGTFADRTAEAGLLDTHGKGLGVAFADPDNDGDSDLYVANDQVPGDFFVNDGRGRFRNVAVENGTALSAAGTRQAGMGVAWGDSNRDGSLDLAVTTFAREPCSLYAQEDDGRFVEAGVRTGLAQPSSPWVKFGIMFGDWDNDGRLDLMMASGHVQDQADRIDPHPGYAQPTLVFHRRNGVYEEVSDRAGEPFRRRIVGRGLAVADFDRDGRLDAVVGNLKGPPLLLRNESDAGNWVFIRLRGAGPNTAGIGAQLRARVGGRVLLRRVRSDGSYLSAMDPVARFGLGGQKVPLDVDVRWPDGARQRVRITDLNRHWVLHHPRTGRPAELEK
jgi:hypothetical protein